LTPDAALFYDQGIGRLSGEAGLTSRSTCAGFGVK
jgi:hypothetical protein